MTVCRHFRLEGDLAHALFDLFLSATPSDTQGDILNSVSSV